MGKSLIIAGCLALAACASNGAREPKVVTQTVTVAVPVRCSPDLGPEPAYPDSDAALRLAPDLFARVQRLVAGRLLRIARQAQTSAALAACAGETGDIQ